MRSLGFVFFYFIYISNCLGQSDRCYWIEPDETYIHSNVAEWPGSFGSLSNNYSSPIDLPFDFNFFGTVYNQVVLTTEGTIAMGNTGYIDFLPSAFPNPLNGETIEQYNHICGFWSDFDFSSGGDLYYKVTDEALYVNYVNVGTWPSNTSKTNTFQMIIAADGNSVLENGNNVQFYYKDMNWANGLLSGASGGLGSVTSLANVGADKASGSEHFSFGRFNLSSDVYNGPFGVASNQQDGIQWLEGRKIEFNTATSSSNMPPVFASDFCQNIKLCGDFVPMNLQVFSSESNQMINLSSTGLPTGMSYSTTAYTAAMDIHFTVDFDVIVPGNYQIELVATDNGSPSESTTYQFEVVISDESYDLQITGEAEVCAGVDAVWSATSGMDHYFWENGDTTSTLVVQSLGVYDLIATKNECVLRTSKALDISPPFIPQLVNGNNPIAICPNEDTVICVVGNYETYEWFVYPGFSGDAGEFTEGTPLTESCVAVEGVSGVYAVRVTDEDGCEGLNIKIVNAPNIVLPEVPPLDICELESPLQISGGYLKESDNLVFYGLSTNQNGWQGSYLQIKVFHIDGSVDSVYFTTFSALTQLSNLETITGDSISIEYFANGNDFAGNTLWFYNCGETAPTIFPAPLTSGIIWSGMSTCGGLPLTGEWVVDGPDGWTLSETTSYDTQFNVSSNGSYTLCFTPDACEHSYCSEVNIANELNFELLQEDTVFLCQDEMVNILLNADPQYDINWIGDGLDIAADNLSAVAGPYEGNGSVDIIAFQENACGVFSDGIQIIYLNELNPGLSDEMFTCGDLLLDPFPGESNDEYIECTWTEITTGEIQNGSTYYITNPGFYSGQFSNYCYSNEPVLFEVIFEDTLSDSGELNGESVFCDNEGLEIFTAEQAEATYFWSIVPQQAGVIINTDLNQLTLDFTDGFTGNAMISVILSNTCGSAYPSVLEVFIDDCSSVNESNHPALRIYPNPAQDYLIVDSQEHIDSIKIFDQIGHEVWSGTDKLIDIGFLPVGVYLFSIYGQNISSIQRVEILR